MNWGISLFFKSLMIFSCFISTVLLVISRMFSSGRLTTQCLLLITSNIWIFRGLSAACINKTLGVQTEQHLEHSPFGLYVNSEDQAEDVSVILVVEHNQPARRESLAWYREVICCHQHQLTLTTNLFLLIESSPSLSRSVNVISGVKTSSSSSFLPYPQIFYIFFFYPR